jgi:FkbM family methyltransferase
VGIRRLTRRKCGHHQKERERFRRFCADLPGIASEPVFVKVGANDGITGDPCSSILLAEPKWKGLLIEPVPHCFDRLRATFRDPRRFFLERVAVSTRAGEASFYYVDPKARESLPHLPLWIDQLGSFDRSHIVKHLDGVLQPFIIECTVEVQPLTALLRRHGMREVHLLHVDTEGHDYEVLKSLDLAADAPLAIFVEHKHLPDSQRSEMLGLLRARGYSVRDCGNDYFALDEKAFRRRRWRARIRA